MKTPEQILVEIDCLLQELASKKELTDFGEGKQEQLQELKDFILSEPKDTTCSELEHDWFPHGSVSSRCRKCGVIA